MICFSGLPPNGNWISQLANRCRSLEKLFLTAARIVKDADLVAIAQYCPNLKQLDVLGNSYITWEGCSRLMKCFIHFAGISSRSNQTFYFPSFFYNIEYLTNAGSYGYWMLATAVKLKRYTSRTGEELILMLASNAFSSTKKTSIKDGFLI